MWILWLGVSLVSFWLYLVGGTVVGTQIYNHVSRNWPDMDDPALRDMVGFWDHPAPFYGAVFWPLAVFGFVMFKLAKAPALAAVALGQRAGGMRKPRKELEDRIHDLEAELGMK